MPEFALVDALRPLSLATILGSLLVGLQAGFFYAFYAGLGVRIIHTMTLFSMFFFSMALIRWLDGDDSWASWFGIWLLSLLFASGQSVGYSLRLRLVRHQHTRKLR